MLATALAFSLLPLSAFAAVNPKDPKFQSFLEEIGMNQEEFITYLQEYHDYTLEDFTNLAELKDYLGDPLTKENLQELLDEFELTRAELEKLLRENGMSLDEFVFYDDLYFEVADLLGEFDLTDEEKEEIKREMLAVLSEVGIDEQEAQNLRNHLVKVIEKTGEEAFLAKLFELSERLEAIPEFDSASELSPAQIAELLGIWDDMLNLFQVKAEYFLVKNGFETPVSLSALIKMDDIGGADLLIKIYSAYDGSFLADVLITKEMFGSDLIKGTGQKTKQAAKTVSEKDSSKKVFVARTVKGGKLPNTASGYIPNALAGLAMIAVGVFLFRRLKIKGA